MILEKNTPSVQSKTPEGHGAGSSAAPPAPPPSPPPRKGPPAWMLMTLVGAAAAAFIAGASFGPFWDRGRPAGAVAEAGHDHGSGAVGEDVGDEGGDGTAFYTCGMHPWVILPAPGLCPICHMDLTPLDPAKLAGEISIDPVITQNIGVRVAPVVRGPVERTLRTVGTVDYNETAVRDVSTKISGWIERLHVDSVGQRVEAGEPLFEVYSPELYAAQEEYLLALRGRAGAPANLLEAARTKLRYFDVTDEQLSDLERAGSPAKTMTIRSPHTGVVIAKGVNEGVRIDPGTQVYRIADLSSVWVLVSLYEYQLPYVEAGQHAVMSLPYIPGKQFEGRVVYVYPYLDPETRQGTVRLEFPNEDGLLKPGMFASVELRGTLAQDRTLAPRSAVIDTGARQVAFVSLGEGKFEPRGVTMGVQAGDGMVEILDGLKPGEMVVTSGQFLLDSEARIREGLAKMVRGEMAAGQKPVVATAGRSELASLPGAAAAAVGELLDSAFAIGDLLAADTTRGIADPAREAAAAVDRLIATPIPEDERFWHRHDEAATVRGKALELAGEHDLERARVLFADLNIALAKLVRATGVPPAYGSEVQLLHCPMYRDGQGGTSWLQKAGPVRNPYYGSVMLECFDERHAMPVTGATAEPEGAGGEPAPAEPAASPAPETPSPEAQAEIDRLFAAYLAVQERLAENDLEGAKAGLAKVRGAAASLRGIGDGPLAQRAEELARAAEIDGASLETFREGFRGLSDGLIALAGAAPPRSVVHEAYCPMVDASWLQRGDEVANPYDPGMLRCGSIEGTFGAGGREDGR